MASHITSPGQKIALKALKALAFGEDIFRI